MMQKVEESDIVNDGEKERERETNWREEMSYFEVIQANEITHKSGNEVNHFE